jgi:eukaryotic-like serine/threonine-protein kinase
VSAPIAPGEIFAGKYRIERVLGQGGMGVVLAATHLALGQIVAIKVLLTESATPDSATRFLREAQALVRLKSEHAARVLDVGEADPGTPYMVMEYLEGSDLADVIAQHRQLRVSDAVDYLLQAGEAIAEAHAAGIVHRDLKPANLFLTKAADGSAWIKVLDFGISKAMEPEGAPKSKALTATTAVFGSPAYMSPEQMRSARDADARSDLWSLAVILYEMLTGALPFDGPTYPDLVLAVNTTTPAKIATFRSDVPEALEAAILRCFERNREHRWPGVAELARAIAPFGSAEAEGSARRIARTAGLSTAPASAAIPAAAPPAAAPAPPRSAIDRAGYDPIASSPLQPAAAPVRSTATSMTGDAPPAPAPGKARDRWLLLGGLGLGIAGSLAVAVLLLHGRPRPVDPAPVLGAERPASERPERPVDDARRPAPPASAGPEIAVSSALPPASPPDPSTVPAALAPRPAPFGRLPSPPTGLPAIPAPPGIPAPPAIPTPPIPALPAPTVAPAAPPATAPPAPTKKSPFDVTIK